MEHGRSGRGKPNPPLRSLELHKIMPRGPGAITLYREEIMGRICCMCKQQMSAIAEEEKSITCLCRDAASHLIFSRNMLTFLCAFRLFFSEVALTHHNAEGNDAALQLSSRFSSNRPFLYCVDFMIPALSSVSKSEQIIPRGSIMPHVLPVKTEL